jgi:CRP-like cAMP-binding protein
VSHGDQTVAELGPGDFFGEGALLGTGRRNATVRTTSPSKVLVMFGTEFRRLEQEQPQIVATIEAVMRQRLAPLPD